MSSKLDKKLLKKIVQETINESDWYSDEYETMADRKYADRPQEEERRQVVWRKLERGHWGRVADMPREGDVVVYENDPIMDMSYAERQQELENAPSNV